MKDSKKTDRRKFIKNSFMSAVGGGIYLNSINRTTTLSSFFAEDKDSGKKESKEEIEYRKLGKIGYKTSVLGFGAMITKDPAVLVKALDMGVNYIDTARGYQNGNNEVMVGKVIKNRRKELFLTTKERARSKETILEGAEKSLKALDTDYVDCILAHGLSGRESVFNEDIMSALGKLKKEGKARYVGASTHSNEAEVINAMVDAKFYDLVTVRYNFRSDENLQKAVERASKAGIAVVAMKVMSGGDGYAGDAMKGLNPFQSALKWVMNDKNVATTIPSITSFEQLDENFGTMGTNMSWSDRKTLDKFANASDKLYCRTCGECTGICPGNVNIPDVMRFLMYADGYGEIELGRDEYKSLLSSESASRCTECDYCVVPCANRLNIRERMLRAHEVLV